MENSQFLWPCEISPGQDYISRCPGCVCASENSTHLIMSIIPYVVLSVVSCLPLNMLWSSTHLFHIKKSNKRKMQCSRVILNCMWSKKAFYHVCSFVIQQIIPTFLYFLDFRILFSFAFIYIFSGIHVNVISTRKFLRGLADGNEWGHAHITGTSLSQAISCPTLLEWSVIIHSKRT